MAAVDLGTAEWERSKISTQDINMLKKLGINKKPKALCFPSEESYPTPPMGYRVSFVDHLIRGLSAPIHPFLRGLLFIYGLQLHHLTPNSILHISIFITLCEAFLGVQPNWALWKRIFFCRRNGSPNVAYNIGGVVMFVPLATTSTSNSLTQGWRKKWLYIQEENHGCAEDNIPPFDGAEKIFHRRSWDAETIEEYLMARIHELQNTRGKELSGIQITAYFLRTRVQPLQARKYPLWKYAGDKDADRLSVDLEPMIKELVRIGSQFIGYREYASRTEGQQACRRSCSKLEQSEAARKKAELDASEAKAEADEAKAKAASTEELQKRLEDAEAALNEHKAAQATREKGILKRLNSQNRRFQGQTNQEFDLENPNNDPLLDALSYLEFHGSEIREGVVNADAGLSKLFPYFFPKKEEPKTFLALAKSFNPSEDLGLKMRQENMKIAVESVVALVASQQNVDWMKVGDTEQIEQTKWRSLIKAAKPNTKKILAYLGIKPSSTPSS
ncbi:hypothetical protein QYE76_056689 [Lolium multiflorum]|uniref:Transposase (putative) gypsy type domain-containing protein n=1 Tax=Lolium multiflorum TaxID=4521 RepID=A0AAD8WQS1_LOLMU|nr:hypothetical protein QYE76_056689 [Lolium multiflorum]